MTSQLTLWDHIKEFDFLGGIANGIGRFYAKLFGSRNERIIREHLAVVASVNDYEAYYEALSDEELSDTTEVLRKEIDDAIAAKGGKAILEAIEKMIEEFRSDDADNEAKKYREIENKVLDETLPKAYAAMREATKRKLRIRHYDVQLLGGIFLHQNRIAEMITGEGKTLVANLPSYLNALPGRGVHVITVNDYLAKRDRDWNAQLFETLGMQVGVIQAHMDNDVRREAYASDITYGTNSEFGFDYLRDNMKTEFNRQVQGRFVMVEKTDESGVTRAKLEPVNPLNKLLGNLNYAIVDEVDSILIDEARTPLIIAGGAREHTNNYYEADIIASKMKGIARPKLEEMAIEKGVEKGELEDQWDFVFSEKDRSIYYTEQGLIKAEQLLGRGSLYDAQNHDWPHFIEQALAARNLYKKDVHYVIQNQEVVIVDENTGRQMVGRTWSDGLHQAIEAKEQLPIKQETQTLATITLQNYFRLYGKLGGMTGTAMTEAEEFQKIYKLDCVAMPTNWPLNRINFPDVIYKTLREKERALCAEVEAVSAIGRPILVGTVSVENSERLSDMLSRRGIKHDVLNAKQHLREAAIVEVAGQIGRVTIATNMAGRGTDIVLGKFSQKELLNYWKDNRAAPKDLEIDDPKFYEKLIEFQKNRKLRTNVSLYEELQFRGLLKKINFNGETYESLPLTDSIAGLGGLHIVGSERHESRRIDNQLRGRCGRQGDPGSSRFYLSLEDNLMRIFASDRVTWLLEKMGFEEDQELSHPWVTGSIEKAQKKVEAHHFDIRKNLLEYDGVMDEQRKLVYGERQSVLTADKLDKIITRWLETTLESGLERYASGKLQHFEWDLTELCEWFFRKFQTRVFPKDLEGKEHSEIDALLWEKVKAAYAKKREENDPELFNEVERFLLLEKIDEKWKDHLHAMDQLRSVIGWSGIAQEDPKIRYKKQGYAYFDEMWENIADEISDLIFRVQINKETESQLQHDDNLENAVETKPEDFEAQRAARADAADQAAYAGSTGTEKQAPVKRSKPKVKRNAKCPCGSGKKYKKCCEKKDKKRR